jgi:hypothetical protein
MTVALFSIATALIVVAPAVLAAAFVVECCIGGTSYDRAIDDVQAFLREREAPQRMLGAAARPPFDPVRYTAAIDRALPMKAHARQLLWHLTAR